MAFRYPPYTDASKKQVVFKPRVPFKRGESLEDQKVGRSGGLLRKAVAVAIVAAVLGLTKGGEILSKIKSFFV
jgi:hypothetical protein